MAREDYTPGASTRPRVIRSTTITKGIVQVALMDRRGYDIHEIADRLGISEDAVQKSIEEVHTKYMDAVMAQREELVAEKRAQLRELRKEAWEAWERSKGDRERTVTETRPGALCPKCKGQGKDARVKGRVCHQCSGTGRMKDSKKLIQVHEGRLPSNEYLKTIIETLREEAELLQLTSPGSVNTQVNVVAWDTLLAQARESRTAESGGTGDVIASKLHAIEARLIEETGGKGGNGSSEKHIL
jgi:predicted transcriptional regulator